MAKRQVKLHPEDTASLLAEIAAAGGVGVVRPSRNTRTTYEPCISRERADAIDAQAEREAEALAAMSDGEVRADCPGWNTHVASRESAIRFGEVKRKYGTLAEAAKRCAVEAALYYGPAQVVESVLGGIVKRRETTRAERALTTLRNKQKREAIIAARRREQVQQTLRIAKALAEWRKRAA